MKKHQDRFNIDLPSALADSISAVEDQRSRTSQGVKWLYDQRSELINAAHLYLHFYIFSDKDIEGVAEVLRRLALYPA